MRTIKTWEIQIDYGQGFERVHTEHSRKEASARLSDYRDNEPGYPIRLKQVMEKVDEN